MPTVLAFFLSRAENSGQRLICFQHLNNNVEVLHQDFLFPNVSSPYECDVSVNNVHFRIIFDRYRHQYDHSQVSYLFVRLHGNGNPMDIWPENDMDSILEGLLLYPPSLPTLSTLSNTSPD
ncbi:hypothetical protein M404DRAFT_24415 [Pisolithus tinctorius Marx 270]|uniref:Uncharacterized protein n=1 Tax=Pisolithus tinctorius Marx 270 TaxID=870435 RepID=A0A0C3P0W1_PISTI|nr:hypothetical protein M404DRAFT_24415 [Pisolithus tinctorius Marx 270]